MNKKYYCYEAFVAFKDTTPSTYAFISDLSLSENEEELRTKMMTYLEGIFEKDVEFSIVTIFTMDLRTENVYEKLKELDLLKIFIDLTNNNEIDSVKKYHYQVWVELEKGWPGTYRITSDLNIDHSEEELKARIVKYLESIFREDIKFTITSIDLYSEEEYSILEEYSLLKDFVEI